MQMAALTATIARKPLTALKRPWLAWSCGRWAPRKVTDAQRRQMLGHVRRAVTAHRTSPTAAALEDGVPQGGSLSMTRWCIAATVMMRWQRLTDRQGHLLPETMSCSNPDEVQLLLRRRRNAQTTPRQRGHARLCDARHLHQPDDDGTLC